MDNLLSLRQTYYDILYPQTLIAGAVPVGRL